MGRYQNYLVSLHVSGETSFENVDGGWKKRASIVALRLSGHSINQISRQIDCGCNIYTN